MTKASEALAALAAAETEEEGEVKTLLADVATLNSQVADLEAKIAALPDQSSADADTAAAIAEITAKIKTTSASIAATVSPAPAPPADNTGSQTDVGAASTQDAGSGEGSVSGGTGDDSVSGTQTDAGAALTQDTGAGNDSVSDSAGDDSASAVEASAPAGGSGDDSVTASTGSDTVEAGGGDVPAATDTPAAETLQLLTTRITAAVGQAGSGMLQAGGGKGPYDFSGDGSGFGVTLRADGSYDVAANPSPGTGTFAVLVTDLGEFAQVTADVTVVIE